MEEIDLEMTEMNEFDEKEDKEEEEKVIDEKEYAPKTGVHQQYGLPIRLIWELNVKVIEAKLSKSTAEQIHGYQVYCKLEVGKDAHYQNFETEKLKYNKANDIITWKGDEKGVPEKLFQIHDFRREKIKISLWSEGFFGSYTAASFASMLYSLKKVTQGRTTTGWIKLKNGETGMKDRTVTSQIKLSLSLSNSQQKGYLFLIDYQVNKVLFYQSVPTMGDLNPVFNKHDSTPFLFEGDLLKDEDFQIKLKNGEELLYTLAAVDSSNLPKRSILLKDNKNSVKLDCTLSTNPQKPSDFMIEGPNWNGKLVLVSKIPVWKIDIIKFENSMDITVGHAEWRNMRDEKIEIKVPKEDCAFIISLLVGLRRIQSKFDTKSLYF